MKRWGPLARIVVFGASLLVAALLPAALARNCTKGKPCGNTCINVNYTCHVGTTTTAPVSAAYTVRMGDLPDPSLTPGDVLTTDVSRICTPGYSKTVRDVPEALKDAVYKEYGIAHHAPYSYEVDHLISLELGGSNSIRNLWPESYTSEPLNAHVKDRLENKLHELVCNGQLAIGTAQHAEATNWVRAYVKYVGPLPTK